MNNQKEQETKQDHTAHERARWWQLRFWQIVVAVLILLGLTIPVPIFLNNVAATIVLTWISILSSIGGTWYFAYESFNRNQLKAQKEKALIAIRRPMEIARAVQRILRNISTKKEIVSKFEQTEIGPHKRFIVEVFEGIELHVKELFGHLSYAVADWQDILGEDLKIADETYNSINDILLIGEREIEEIKSSYESRLKEAESKGKEEKLMVENELNKEIQRIKSDTAIKVKDAYEQGKRDSEILRMGSSTFGTTSSPIFPSASAPIFPDAVQSGRSLGDFLKPQSTPDYVGILARAAHDMKCPNCGSYDTEITGSVSPAGFLKRRCKSCNREYNT